ncbi:MAG: LysM peptidoglycan-binding domain-containing protein [Chloroflexi bacterium]|nr:LysM peptidoglycan-binding domain-containing protein [Chloroflexota bacterium]
MSNLTLRLRLIPSLFVLLAALTACTRPAPSPTAPAVDAVAIVTPTPLPPASPLPDRTPLPATATATPTPTSAPTLPPPSATPTPTPAPTVAPDLALEFVTVHRDDFLSTLATRYGVSVDEIMAYNQLTDANQLAVGQGLIIPHHTQKVSPAQIVLADSEFVYGPAYSDFDVAAFVAHHPGYLRQYRTASGRSGADVVESIARQYSVGPRVLLALLEARGGWLSNPEPQGTARSRPLGHLGGAEGLWAQLEWAADALNRGFYGWQDRGETAIRFRGGSLQRGAPGLNPATVALQVMLAQDVRPTQLRRELQAFQEAYQRLFASLPPADTAPALPLDLEQGYLQLPWAHNQWWYLTGGPHGGWGSGSGWAALDFVPETPAVGSCGPLAAWAVAAADGVVAYSAAGEVLLDLDGDGDIRTGWVLQYLHMAERPVAGTRLKAGDPVGRPSCEGGVAAEAHLHFARRYNGVWVAAAGPVPLVLDGWRARGDFEYDGTLTKPGRSPRTACDCRQRQINGILW